MHLGAVEMTPLRRNLNRSPYGFTLIEMLVVIGIISLLVAILGSVLNKLRERTKMASVKTLIEKCYSGIEQYHITFRAYPPATTPGGLTGVQALYYYVTTTFSPNPIAANGEVWSDVYCASCTQFQAAETRPNGAGTDIVDSWTMPLVYKMDVQTDQYGIQTFRPLVYSCGINKVDDGGLINTDDVYIGK
jgi:prepilin-type N-terminal cleavage/methylation domain-containing protein